MRRDLLLVDLSKKTDVYGWVIKHVASDESIPQRAAKLLAFFVDGADFMREVFAGHCESGAMLSRRLGFSDNVANTIRYLWEQWNGKGVAYGLKGPQIPHTSRILHFAQVMEVAYRLGGEPSATTIAKKRRGKDFDPDIVDAYLKVCGRPDFWSALRMESAKGAILDIRPESPYGEVTDEHVENMCEVLADFIDIKSPFTWGHSKAVAEAAVGIGTQLGLADEAVNHLRRAALVHDLGKVTVPCSVMEKKEGFSSDEWEHIRLHAYYTERILSRVELLQDLGSEAAAHHEWYDGSGYPKQLKGEQITLGQRILALADAFATLSNRQGESVPTESVLRQMKGTVGTQFDPVCYEGLVAYLQGKPRVSRALSQDQRPGNLSEREVEVLREVAKGMRNRQIAESLVISEKTVERHLENIYAKLDVTSRTSAVVFAVQNGLVL
ncbi:MAG: HD domain-containing phosphohydrolase [Anaerolineae bacterium]